MSYSTAANLGKTLSMFNLGGIFKEQPVKEECQENHVLLNAASMCCPIGGPIEAESKAISALDDIATVDLQEKEEPDKETANSVVSDMESASTAEELTTKILGRSSSSHKNGAKTVRENVKSELVNKTNRTDHSDEPQQETSADDQNTPRAPSLSTAHRLLEDQYNWHLLVEYAKRQKILEEKYEKLSNQLAELLLEHQKDKEEISQQAERLKLYQKVMHLKEVSEQNSLTNGVNGVNEAVPKFKAHLLEVDTSDESY